MNLFEQSLEEEKITGKLELEEYEEKNIRETEILKAEISYKTQSMDIESILNSLKNSYFVLPKYQRKFVWDKEEINSLILSLIKNIPIPPLYLYFQDDGKYVILDGQQRITSIFLYFNNIFFKDDKNRSRLNFEEISKELLLPNPELNKKFNLEEVKYNVENNDITFKNMSDKIKRILLRKSLDIVFVQCNSEDVVKVYSDIFKLLNSAGRPLSNQEIRNGIFIDNALYDEIEKINLNKVWRTLYGTNSIIYRDFEYLLRFLALSFYTKISNNEIEISYQHAFEYANIIDDFSKKFDRKKNKKNLDKNLKKNREIENAVKLEIFKLEKFFKDIEIETEKINPKKKISILILEAIFVAYCKLELYNKNIRINYKDFLSKLDNKTFAISRSTSSKVSIIKRLNAAYKILKRKYIDFETI